MGLSRTLSLIRLALNTFQGIKELRESGVDPSFMMDPSTSDELMTEAILAVLSLDTTDNGFLRTKKKISPAKQKKKN